MTKNTDKLATEEPQKPAPGSPLFALFMLCIIVLLTLGAIGRVVEWINEGPLPRAPKATPSVPTVQATPVSDAEATCKGKNFSAGSLYDQPGGLSIDNTSQRWKNYSDLLMNGQASIRGYAIGEGYCFVHLDVDGIVNGNSVSGSVYALMN